MKRWLAWFVLAVSCITASAQGLRVERQFSDDSWVHVPLQFAFPMYGVTFTNSFMFSNGVVALMGVGQTPATTYCCSGENINQGSSPVFNYTIMPLQTDLLPVAVSRFWTEGTNQYQRYSWQNIAEYSNPNNLNTFSVELRPTGYIGITYESIRIQNQVVTSAVVGNASRGEFQVNYHGWGLNNTQVPGLIEIGATAVNQCYSDPLSSPTCPGYAEAYQAQQCSANPLYAPTCPGYAEAYHAQQCSANPLYAVTCAGYAEAQFAQQCSADALYDNRCPGYAEAYHAQQCSANPLYASSCPGYAEAYHAQQCQASALYDSGCPGYAEARFAQQCSADALYDSKCPGYAQAYAAKYVLPANDTTAKQAVAEPVAEPAVAVAAAATETTSPVSPTSVVSVTRPPETAARAVSAAAAPPAPERKSAAPAPARNTASARSTVRAAVQQQATQLAERVSQATTLEQQQAVQEQVIGAMGAVPGFSAYQNAVVPDGQLYRSEQVYRNQTVVDNQRVLRQLGGANDRLHQQLTEEQYKKQGANK